MKEINRDEGKHVHISDDPSSDASDSASPAADGRLREIARAKLALDVRLQQIGGCGNAHCIVYDPPGMHTNGGCKCPGNRLTMQKVVDAYRRFATFAAGQSHPSESEDGASPHISPPGEQGGGEGREAPYFANGWLFHNPDTGIEWSAQHPVESGEVPDAYHVRRPCADELLSLLVEAWEAREELLKIERPSPAQPSPGLEEGGLGVAPNQPNGRPAPMWSTPEARAFALGKQMSALYGLHIQTSSLVGRFAFALANKLAKAEVKYGWSDGWARDDWRPECLEKLMEHVGKGDPIDVAAYAAFCWHHGWSTQDAALSRPPIDWGAKREEIARVIIPGFRHDATSPWGKCERDTALTKADSIIALVKGGGQ